MTLNKETQGFEFEAIQGATGATPDENAALQSRVEQLQRMVDSLEIERNNLQRDNESLTSDVVNKNAQVLNEEVSDEAARKRVARLCRRQADGIL